jgi:hypothetical protein
VAVVDLKRSVGGVSKQYHLALWAAATLAAVTLVGCGDSPTAAANKSAGYNSDKAAHMSASAGDVRPSDSLIRQVHETPLSGLDALERDLSTQSKSNSAAAYSKFLQQRPALDDLRDATKLIKEALPSGDAQPSDAVKAILLAQQAQIASQAAEVQLTELQNAVLDLTNRAAQIQALSNRIIMTGSLATAAESRKDAGPKNLSAALDTAKAALTAAQSQSKDKADALKALEDQIAAKRADAQKLYDQAQADQLAADRGKGDASVQAYSKALEVKGQADKLIEEATILQTKRDAAATDAQVATIQAKEAEDVVNVLTDTDKRQAGNVAAAQTDATSLRERATALVNAPDGLTAQVKDFRAQLAHIDALVTQIGNASTEASTNFSSAARMGGSGSDTPARELRPLLTICQASASFRAGEANMGGWVVADLLNQVTQSENKAYAVVKLPIAEEGAGNKGNAARDEAIKKFSEADSTLNTLLNTNLPDTGAPKWLALSLRAITNNGLYVLTSDTKYQTMSQTLATEALARNPNLPIRGLAE